MFKSFFLEIVIYLILPLLGWVLGSGGAILADPGTDLASFVANPARLGFTGLVVLQALATGLVQVRLPPGRSRTGRPRSQTSQWRNIAFESILVLSPFCDRRELLVIPEGAAARLAGLVLYAAGSALVVWALVSFRRVVQASTEDTEKPPLVVAGPFHSLRYPAHLGSLALSLGIALVFRSWIGIAALLLMVNFTLSTIQFEEQEKSTLYKEVWAAYRQHSWRLLPFIY